MSSNVIEERNAVLRLEISIAAAVRERGVLLVIGAALRAWWAQWPASYSEVPASLRADIGLPPAADPDYLGIGLDLWRLHPPLRRWP
ncbi:hypothetical protein O9Z70_02380 [Devosia sp. YIM 151766]|uniref:hypothetical protein n=1 Tax=Devosia sp. YIM 151766 TaxID=3017325 RepID=UPI00255D0F11|nr:hypothetical protein [Devosia sp. YIM 151766]WIY53404.1 hypothetical protein O9Z70_02380 [Devosia sp. YIM 151766]